MIKKYDISGQTFGYLTVICQDESTIGQRNSKWLCKCKCGNTTIVTRSSLVNNHTLSCGCKKHESHNATHNMSKTRLYRIWRNIKNRCNRKEDKYWNNYGGRGIRICEEWDSDFLNFYNWSINNGYSDLLSIERIDVNLDYCPDNCKWIPIEEQQRNKTNNIFVVYNGEKKCLKTLCAEINFPYQTAYRRYSRLKAKGKDISIDYLFAPIQEDKISKCYRKY